MNKQPLSYNPVDTDALKLVLDQYEGKLHQQIVTDFEKELSSYVGAKYVVALNSGTAAIHLALRALGVNAGDTVMAPTFTYVATVNPVLYQNARPAFIDSEPITWNIDPDYLEKGIKELLRKGEKIKAIIVVHTYGMPCFWNQIREIGNRHEIPIIEDAAEALGSKYEGKMAGTLGEIGIYSFNNNKIFTTYGGGALVTNSKKIAEKVRFMASQAREPVPYYRHSEPGFNYLMGSLNAAYGLAQFSTLESRINARRQLFNHYQSIFTEYNCQKEPEFQYSNRWLTTIDFGSLEKATQMAEDFESKCLETRRLWNPMHLQPLFKDASYFGSNVASGLFERGLCLPAELGPSK